MVFYQTYNVVKGKYIYLPVSNSIKPYFKKYNKYDYIEGAVVLNNEGEYEIETTTDHRGLNWRITGELFLFLNSKTENLKFVINENNIVVTPASFLGKYNKVYNRIGETINGIKILDVLDVKERKSKGGKYCVYTVLCECHCGKTFVSNFKNIRSGVRKSCGCLKPKTSKKSMEKIKDMGYKELDKYRVEKTNLLIISNKKSTSSTGVKGVYKNGNKYYARITFKGITYKLGGFYTLEEAKQVREEAEEKLFKPILEKYNFKK